MPSTGSTAFYLTGHGLADPVDFMGEVTSVEGKPVEGATLTLTQPTASNGSHSATGQLETRGLRPGEYILVAKAVSAAEQPPSGSIRFVVH